MAFTDNCDLYIAIHEEGINRIITHIMRQRPSIFNYGEPSVVDNNNFLCSPIESTKDVKDLQTNKYIKKDFKNEYNDDNRDQILSNHHYFD